MIPVPDDQVFGTRLKEIRKRGVNQVDLTQQLGLHQSLIAQYRSGYLRLHRALLVRLAPVLDTTPDEILALKAAAAGPEAARIDRRFLRRL